ncbi:hypothetical protein CROQUDRAFT_656673, partial [Cronartium quercuum f. sp. fusiforme G11]
MYCRFDQYCHQLFTGGLSARPSWTFRIKEAPANPFILHSPSTSFHIPFDASAPTLPHQFLPSPFTSTPPFTNLPTTHRFISIYQNAVGCRCCERGSLVLVQHYYFLLRVKVILDITKLKKLTHEIFF